MKRGIELLIGWLVIAVCTNLLVPHSIPPDRMERLVFLLTVSSFPLAALVYARYASRVSAVICFGLVAGVLAIIPLFTDRRGLARDITGIWEFFIFSAPVFMALACAGFYSFGRRLWSR
jgi:hypothetical protein